MISAGLSLYSKAAKKVIIKLAPVKKKKTWFAQRCYSA